MPLPRWSVALKALSELGPEQVGLFALYRFGLWTGHYKRLTTDRGPSTTSRGQSSMVCRPLFDLPSPESLLSVLGANGKAALLAEADEISAGRVRLFGGEPVELKLTVEGPLAHWTDYETGKASIPHSAFPILHSPSPDIKFIWEPARFGWAFTLGRAYHISADEKYAQAFWRYAEQFLDGNPPYQGPHWMSGQEVALRLMAFVWAGQVFAPSPHSTPARMERLTAAVAAHARRIPPTLVYARSQNNNHLLTEAAGLYTAGLALPDDPEAAGWRALGWKWLCRAFNRQIDAFGEYTQHSTNYHRMLLQVALWVFALSTRHGEHFPRAAHENLVLATHWLWSLLDADSGCVPNLGANDGAHFLPLTVLPFEDYRPVVQAAAHAFMKYQLPAGAWDEMGLWFGLSPSGRNFQPQGYLGDQMYAPHSWGALRAVRYHSRPSHADQLHLDLWWRGLNVARDAGTYLYNADPPWDNALTSTLVHNTISVQGQEQMTRAGRFLYLDWADATRKSFFQRDDQALQRVSARHYGYRRLGVRHDRMVSVYPDERWLVEDDLLCLSTRPVTFRLHWLLPDWPWKLDKGSAKIVLSLASPHGPVTLRITADQPIARFSLARAGEIVSGEDTVQPIRGWTSPTYGLKVPALSLAVEVVRAGDVQFNSEFTFDRGP